MPSTPMSASARGPSCPRGYAWRKHAPAGLAARRAAPTVQAVFAHLRAHHGNLEDLVSHGFARRHHRRTALADRGGGAVDDLIDLGFVHQRAVTARMTLLRPTFAWAGAALRPVGAARAVRGRRLGRRFGIQCDALVQPSDFLLLLGHQLHQRVDHLVALRQGGRLGRLNPWGEFCNRLGRLHGRSFAAPQRDCKTDFVGASLAE